MCCAEGDSDCGGDGCHSGGGCADGAGESDESEASIAEDGDDYEWEGGGDEWAIAFDAGLAVL